MKQVIKSLQVRASDQPCIQFPPVLNEDERRCRIEAAVFEIRASRIMNFIVTAKRLRAKQPLMNKDTSWNKRLKLTHDIQALKRRQTRCQHQKKKRQRVCSSTYT